MFVSLLPYTHHMHRCLIGNRKRVYTVYTVMHTLSYILLPLQYEPDLIVLSGLILPCIWNAFLCSTSSDILLDVSTCIGMFLINQKWPLFYIQSLLPN